MATFIPDTDPDLRSLLAACQAADDPLPPLDALAAWLEGRGDSRGPVVRLQTRYWYVYYSEEGFRDHYAAEAEELQRRSEEECEPVIAQWLGFHGDGSNVAVARQMPLLDLQIFDLEPVRAHLPKLRELVQAGWVWDLYFLGIAVDDSLTELLPIAGPVRQISFGKEAAAALRDGDLAALKRIPSLRTLILSDSRISDAGRQHLHRIRSLRIVELEKTRVTRTGLVKLVKALPDCKFLGP